MIGGRRIQVGLPYAGKTAEITIEADTYQITVESGITITAARTTSRDIRRHKASNYTNTGRTSRRDQDTRPQNPGRPYSRSMTKQSNAWPRKRSREPSRQQ
jgi:hypothetical protein